MHFSDEMHHFCIDRLHLDDLSTPALSVLLHDNVVHASRATFKGKGAEVLFFKDALSVCVEDLDDEIAFQLQSDADLVSSGVGV